MRREPGCGAPYRSYSALPSAAHLQACSTHARSPWPGAFRCRVLEGWQEVKAAFRGAGKQARQMLGLLPGVLSALLYSPGNTAFFLAVSRLESGYRSLAAWPVYPSCLETPTHTMLITVPRADSKPRRQPLPLAAWWMTLAHSSSTQFANLNHFVSTSSLQALICEISCCTKR